MNFIILLILLLPFKSNAESGPREKANECMARELDLWEANKGRLPTNNEADLIVDFCVKQAYVNEKKAK